jgi:hypothetical protein
MEEVHSLYDPATGFFVGRQVTGQGDHLAAIEASSGLRAMAGAHDRLSKRVDLSMLTVVEWQPPEPDADPDLSWAWDVPTLRWRGKPTLQGLKRLKRAEMADRARFADEADITIGGSVWSDDAEHRAALYQAVQIALMDGSPTVAWHTADGVGVTLTLVQLKAAARVVAARSKAIRAARVAAFAAIAGAVDEAAVAAITWV